VSLRAGLRWAGSIIGAGGVALCITIVSQGMRSVEKIGGVCASGNQPFTVAHQCPAGVPGLLTGGIFAGLFFLALFAFCASDRAKTAMLLSWSALFLVLGWNFLDSGLHPSGGGTSVGNLVCAAIFIVMGAVPLVWTVPQCFKALMGRDDDDASSSVGSFVGASAVRFNGPGGSGGGTSPAVTPTVWPTVTPAPAAAPATVASSAPTVTASRAAASAAAASGGDVASALQRLASLHASGDLTDTEYEEAKHKTLEEPRST
jgi:hypothetical protein